MKPQDDMGVMPDFNVYIDEVTNLKSVNESLRLQLESEKTVGAKTRFLLLECLGQQLSLYQLESPNFDRGLYNRLLAEVKEQMAYVGNTHIAPPPDGTLRYLEID